MIVGIRRCRLGINFKVRNGAKDASYMELLKKTRGGPCQHGLMCGCNFVSSGVMIIGDLPVA